MNLVDCYVTKVLAGPQWACYDDGVQRVEWWGVLVLYESWGRESESTLTFKTKEEADAVTEGYHFLA